MNSTWTIDDDRFTTAHNPHRFTIAHNPCVHEDPLVAEKESLQNFCHGLIEDFSIEKLKRFVVNAIEDVPSDSMQAVLPVVAKGPGRPKKIACGETESEGKKQKK
jgi:hypothetical protein